METTVNLAKSARPPLTMQQLMWEKVHMPPYDIVAINLVKSA